MIELATTTAAFLMGLMAAAPLKRGINVDHIFDPYSDSTDPYGTQEYGEIEKNLRPSEFENLKTSGFDFVRLNLGRRPFQDPSPSFKIREEGFALLDRALDEIQRAGLSVIVDCHQIPVPALLKSPEERRAFLDLWRFLAARYKKRPPSVLYSVLNEPRVEKALDWRAFTLDWIHAVRALDPQRTLVVSGGAWGSMDDLMALGPLAHPHLVYDFHFYLPFAFTHQGADWGDEVQTILKNIHYPLRPSDLETPFRIAKEKGLETWPMDDYPETPDAAALERRIRVVSEWAKKNKLGLLCGEFGAIHKGPLADRALWLSHMRSILEKHDIAWAVWAFHSGFDIYDDSGKAYPSLLKALIP